MKVSGKPDFDVFFPPVRCIRAIHGKQEHLLVQWGSLSCSLGTGFFLLGKLLQISLLYVRESYCVWDACNSLQNWASVGRVKPANLTMPPRDPLLITPQLCPGRSHCFPSSGDVMSHPLASGVCEEVRNGFQAELIWDGAVPARKAHVFQRQAYDYITLPYNQFSNNQLAVQSPGPRLSFPFPSTPLRFLY